MSKKDKSPQPAAAEKAGGKASAAPDAAATDGAEAGATLEQQLEAAQAVAAEHKDNYLRMAAELENVRRRSEKRIAEAHQFALADFALAVGEVRDCLEAALTAAEAAGENTREGVELTLRKLTAAMDARHILPIHPDIGAAFDPALHMAIGQMPATPQAKADTIAAVIQAGYMLNGRVIRAANVMVAVEKDAASANAPASKDTAKDTAAEKDGGKSSGKKKPAKN